ncbi:MAG TPA: DUF2905 domain-containing protein [Planctomycetaceae bacterium]|nr:DUF2905 domain-containing protein [Planctomycetaceae bacterium]
MADFGKLLVLLGLVLVVVGLLLWGLGRVGFHGLPGDIRYDGEHVQFYFPVVTCLVVSAMLSGLLGIINWLLRR